MAVVAIATTAVSLKYLGRYQPFADLIRRSEEMPDLSLEARDVTVAARRHGHKNWTIHASSIRFSRDHRSIQGTGIDHGKLFDDHGKALLTFAAGRAAYTTPLGEMAPDRFATLSLSDGIRLAGAGRQAPTLTAQTASWDARKGTAVVPGDVRIDFPSHTGRAICRDVSINTRTGDISVAHIHGAISRTKLVK